MRRAISVLVLAAGTTFTASSCVSSLELNDLRNDVRNLEDEVSRLRSTMDENDRQLFYRLSALQEKSGNAKAASAVSASPQSSVAAIAATGTPAPSPAPALAEAPQDNSAADQLFHQASQAWSDTKYENAQSLFEEFSQKYPNDPRAPEAFLQIGLAHYNKGDYSRALESFQEVTHRYPGSPSEAEAAAQMGYSYIGLNQMEQARRTLEQVLERYPNYDQIEKVKEVLGGLAQPTP